MLRALKELPFVRSLRMARARKRFASAGYVQHFGRFASFADAERAIPAGAISGWDHPALAEAFFDTGETINPRDYPVLYWLRSVWSDRIAVFDYGGHLGMKRYAFERYLDFTAGQQWVICDVPAVIEAARRLADRRNPRHVSFTSDFREAARADVLLCLGVLQFIEEPLPDQLARLERLPRHIIVNGLPLHEHLSFVTLINNAGKGFSPYQIARKSEFIGQVEAAGYELVDLWANVEKGCAIPLHPECNLANYTGLYFRQREPLIKP